MKITRYLVFLVVCWLSVVAFAQQPKVVAIEAGRALDVRTGQMINNVFILIEGERITAVGANVTVPESAEVIDLKTMTVLPGLIDSHTHLTFDVGMTTNAGLTRSVAESPRTRTAAKA